MGEKITLKIEERKVFGKKVKGLRASGLVPGVVYGQGVEPISVQTDAGELRHVLLKAGKHTPINLLGAKKRIAMVKDIEYDPIKSGVVWHVSFHAVRTDELVYAEIPVKLVGVGESIAERAGLVVLQAVEKVEVRALPMDLPEAVEIDILKLEKHGDKVTLGDAKLPEGVEFAERDSGRPEDDEERPLITDLVVASVYEPAALEAANASTAGLASDESSVEVEDSEQVSTTAPSAEA